MDNDSAKGWGLTTVLGVVFIILKLTGTITWSWGWVLAPFWIPLALVGMFVLIALITAAVKNGE